MSWQSLYHMYLESDQWKEKRDERLEIDGHKCQSCGSTDDLQVHHKSYEHIGDEDVEGELVTLCKTCHEKEHDQGVSCELCGGKQKVYNVWGYDICGDCFTKWRRLSDTNREKFDEAKLEYADKLRQAVAPIYSDYIDKQSDTLAGVIANLDKDEWQSIQKIVKLIRGWNYIDVDDVGKFKQAVAAWTKKNLHTEAIQKAAKMRRAARCNR